MIDNIYATTNKHLENFLYMHKIRFAVCRKTEDCQTEWLYKITPDFQRVFEEYRELYCKHPYQKNRL